MPKERITYHTIDGLREIPDWWRDVDEADLLLYIGEMTAPGTYVGGSLGSRTGVPHPNGRFTADQSINGVFNSRRASYSRSE